MWWRPILQRLQKKPEPRPRFLIRNPQRSKNLLLHILAMNSNRPRAKLQSIHRQVIAVSPHTRWIADQVCHIGFKRSGKRVMRRHPFSSYRLILKHRKIRDPDRLKGFCPLHQLTRATRVRVSLAHHRLSHSKSPMPRSIFLCQLASEVSGRKMVAELTLGEPPRKLRIASMNGMRWITGHDD